MATSYTSKTGFSSEPARCIVVSCSDGRIRRQVHEFLDYLGIEADMYTIPGGPLVFAQSVETFTDSSLAHKRIRFLADEHHCDRMILISHGGEDPGAHCAMARLMFRGTPSHEMVAKQKNELLMASQRLSIAIPTAIECWFAHTAGGKVQFEQLT